MNFFGHPFWSHWGVIFEKNDGGGGGGGRGRGP